MKYFFVSLHTSSKSSGNAKLMHSKQVGFEAVSIFRCLIWGVWKEPGSKGGFSAWYVSQKIMYIYICSMCVPMHWAFWVGDWFLLWMFPVPLNGIKLPDSKSCVLVGSELRCPELSWCSAPLGHLLGHSCFHSQQRAPFTWPSSMGTKIFLLLQIPSSLVSRNSSSQAFRFFSLLDLFLKPFFFYNI